MFQAVSLSSVSLITIAFSNPLPLTSLTVLLVSICFCNSLLNKFPSWNAFSANFSSLTTSRAAIATAAAIGLPPKVEPCWPGLITFIISLFANTAETG